MFDEYVAALQLDQLADASAATFWPRLERALLRGVQHLEEHPAGHEQIELWRRSLTSEEALDPGTTREIQARRRTHIDRIVRRGQRAGAIRGDLEPSHLSALTEAMVGVLDSWLFADGKQPGSSELAASVRRGIGMLAATLGPSGAETPAAAPPHLVTDAAATFVALPPAEPVVLAGRPVLRRLMRALIDAHRRVPGAAVSTAELARACWPGEKMLPGSASPRLRTALWSLRRLGLEPVLRSGRGWYALREELVVEVAGS